MPNSTELQQHTARIEELVRQLESCADPNTLATARELVQSIMALYGAGLDRVAATLARFGESGYELLEELGRDELVGNLLAANGLHPLDLDTRVRRGLERLRTKFRSATIELLALDEGIVRLRVRSGTPASIKEAVEEAMYESAPDMAGLVVEEVDSKSGFVPIESLLRAPVHRNGAGL